MDDLRSGRIVPKIKMTRLIFKKATRLTWDRALTATAHKPQCPPRNSAVHIPQLGSAPVHPY
ncbi:Uncharacterized protein APZ42_015183 [Daphnia magna]|uniref:Uncharacterized protein n=1 Tax=Daphnia magna TaxID=35525 RepID=A0A162P8U2_9CRUS|nr:Uncharacterized protein APZ42_015183 [Daphnia magna]